MSELSNTPNRIVHCADAIDWLRAATDLSSCSLVASLPDISEFPSYSEAQWKDWFFETARLVLERTPPEGVTVFYQSDIKPEGRWLDKGYLCQKAAESLGCDMLWHKVACRAPAGQATFGRPGYSHIVCFSQKVRTTMQASTADVLPELGEKTWERGMGIEACVMIGKFIADQTSTRTVVHPFCGQGGMLAVANALGLNAIGIERSPKRAEVAKVLGANLQLKMWLDHPTNVTEKELT